MEQVIEQKDAQWHLLLLRALRQDMILDTLGDGEWALWENEAAHDTSLQYRGKATNALCVWTGPEDEEDLVIPSRPSDEIVARIKEVV